MMKGVNGMMRKTGAGLTAASMLAAMPVSYTHLHMDFSKPIESIESEAPSPLDLPKGCPFQGRCEQCMDICKKEKPQMTEVEPGHQVACHLYGGKK